MSRSKRTLLCLPLHLAEKQPYKMAHLTGTERSRYVQGMFSRIARRYDLMNRLMTAGQDIRWRREVVHRADIPARGRVLDLGAGTGDLARETRRQYPGSHPVAADFTLEMMRVGKNRPDFPALDWSAADALRLPFLAETFDAVVSGFLLRNVIDVPKALGEQYRVLRSGGRVVVLDTTRPTKNAFTPFIYFHLHVLIPFLGRMIAGAGEAYTYLPESTEAFLQAEQLAAYLIQAGFKEVGFHRLMFGTVAIHWGRK